MAAAAASFSEMSCRADPAAALQVKAYYRRAMAQTDDDERAKDLNEAAKLEPGKAMSRARLFFFFSCFPPITPMLKKIRHLHLCG